MKAFLSGLILFFALAIISCDTLFSRESSSGKPNPDGYTANGTPLVELTIGVDDGRRDRALTKTLAQAAVDSYEVIFLLNGELARTSWKEGQTAKLAVPYGTYDNSNDNNKGTAYMFAGRVDAATNTKTLLAVGKLDSANNDTTPDDGIDIGSATTHVTFSLTALETNVNAADADNSSFKIKTPLGSTATVSGEIINDVNKRPILAFIMEHGSDPDDGVFSATFDISISNEYKNAIQLTTPSGQVERRIDLLIAGLSSFDGIIGMDTPAALEIDFQNEVFAWNGNTLSINMDMNINDDTPGKGYSLMYFQVPVHLLDATASGSGVQPEQWYLRGGIQNKLPDAGSNSLGGAVLLGTYIP